MSILISNYIYIYLLQSEILYFKYFMEFKLNDIENSTLMGILG